MDWGESSPFHKRPFFFTYVAASVAASSSSIRRIGLTFPSASKNLVSVPGKISNNIFFISGSSLNTSSQTEKNPLLLTISAISSLLSSLYSVSFSFFHFFKEILAEAYVSILCLKRLSLSFGAGMFPSSTNSKSFSAFWAIFPLGSNSKRIGLFTLGIPPA